MDKNKYGKLPAKEAEEIPRNKICVDIIGPYSLRHKKNRYGDRPCNRTVWNNTI